MAKKNEPQWRHHYVPEFYLKRWRLGGPDLIQYSRPYGPEVKYKWVSPKETGYFDKLYFLNHLPEHLRNAYEEQFFTRIDTKASQVLARMESGDFKFNGAERSAWSRFIMGLIFRNPETIYAVRQRLAEEAFNPTAQEEADYRKRRKLHEPKTLKEALEAERSEDYINEVALRIISGQADNPRIGKIFVNMTWGVRAMPYNAPALLTSDRPIAWALGMRDPDCHIIIPIGPKKIFWAAKSVNMISRLSSISAYELADFMNDHVTRRAVKFVWASTAHNSKFVKATMGVNPPVTIPDHLIEQRWQSINAKPQ